MLERARFVLVGAQQAGNVGAAARALRNLGFGRLELVAPRCDPLDDEARRFAVGGVDVLEAARVHDSLDDALAGAETVVGTSRRVGKHRRPHWRLDELAPELGRSLAAGEVAVVFGREAHGLSDEDLDRCTHLVYFPSDPEFGSFNLAQSVLLAAYELRRAVEGEPEQAAAEPLADHAEREGMYDHLRDALRSIGFLGDGEAVVMRRIRRMLGRAALTREEVKILRGIARQSAWAAGFIPRGETAPGEDEER